MSPRELELPAEALRLIDRVAALERNAARAAAEAREDLAGIKRHADEHIAELERTRHELERDQRAFDALVENRLAGLEFVAAAWGDYETARARATADDLRRKKHPAPKAAKEVREIGRALAKARRQAKLVEWVIAFYENQFPWLAEPQVAV